MVVGEPNWLMNELTFVFGFAMELAKDEMFTNTSPFARLRSKP